MQKMYTAVWLLLSSFGTVACSYIAVSWFRTRMRKTRPAFEQQLLRPPGYSLLLEREQFADRVLGRFAVAILPLLIICVAVGSLAAAHGMKFAIPAGVALAGLWGVLVVRMLLRLIQYLADVETGWRGECLVGEMLTELLKDGCFVFHDVPGDGKWNIDHVVIAPTGVFAVETKTRRKKQMKNAPRD